MRLIAGGLAALAAIVLVVGLGQWFEHARSMLFWGVLVVGSLANLAKAQLELSSPYVIAWLTFMATGIGVTFIHGTSPTQQTVLTVDDVSTHDRRGHTVFRVAGHTDTGKVVKGELPPELQSLKRGDKATVFLQSRIYTDIYGFSVGPCPSAEP